MDSRQRVRLAFAHREPDRVPIFEIHIDSKPAAEILGHAAPVGYGGSTMGKLQNQMIIAGRIEEFQELHMAGRLELLRVLEHDIVRAFPYRTDPPVPKPIGENTWRLEAVLDGHALNVWRSGAGRDDFWSVFAFNPDTDAYVEVESSVSRDGIDRFERMVEVLEERVPDLAGISFRNLERAKMAAPEACAMGWADAPFFPTSWLPVFFEAMALRPDLVDRWFEAQRRQILAMLEEQLRRGADLILGGQDICDNEGPMFSPDHYRRWFQPTLLAITEACHRHGIPYLRHNDGRLGPIERAFLLESGIDGWHAIEPRAGNDIFAIKKAYGDRITLAGNVDCSTTLVVGTPDDVYRETRRKIIGCAPRGGYILSSSNSIHAGVPARNYLAMVDAWRDHGTYPIRAARGEEPA